jgi:hypothetical protein
MQLVRTYAHRSPLYCELRFMEREGLAVVKSRLLRQRAILHTPPIHTAESSPCEVRILTHRGDWINALWTLKSFYYFSGSRLALHIHDGGLFPSQAQVLKRHFPMAHFHERMKTTAIAEAALKERKLNCCVNYRRRNIHTFKLFDFYLLTSADRVIVLDSDVLFFAPPIDLQEAGSTRKGPNRYCRDYQYAYAVPLDRMEELAGTRVISRANSGIACVSPRSIDFNLIEKCLANEPGLSTTYAVVEQSLHAICSARYGIDLLPDEYLVSNTTGLHEGMIAKHYVAFPRPELYREGMATLISNGFLQRLRACHC